MGHVLHHLGSVDACHDGRAPTLGVVDQPVLAVEVFPPQVGVAYVQAVRQVDSLLSLNNQRAFCSQWGCRVVQYGVQRPASFFPQQRDARVGLTVGLDDGLRRVVGDRDALKLQLPLESGPAGAVARAKHYGFTQEPLVLVDGIHWLVVDARRHDLVDVITSVEGSDQVFLPSQPSQHTRLDLAAIAVDDDVPLGGSDGGVQWRATGDVLQVDLVRPRPAPCVRAVVPKRHWHRPPVSHAYEPLRAGLLQRGLYSEPSSHQRLYRQVGMLQQVCERAVALGEGVCLLARRRAGFSGRLHTQFAQRLRKLRVAHEVFTLHVDLGHEQGLLVFHILQVRDQHVLVEFQHRLRKHAQGLVDQPHFGTREARLVKLLEVVAERHPEPLGHKVKQAAGDFRVVDAVGTVGLKPVRGEVRPPHTHGCYHFLALGL